MTDIYLNLAKNPGQKWVSVFFDALRKNDPVSTKCSKHAQNNGIVSCDHASFHACFCGDLT